MEWRSTTSSRIAEMPRTSVSAEMALRLGATFRTSPEFWLNAQKAVDLFRAESLVSDLPPPVLNGS